MSRRPAVAGTMLGELVRTYLLRWKRTRAPLGIAVFVGVLCWYDTASQDLATGAPWWSTVVFIAAWTGFLVGYDTFERYRAEGSLRLLLLHPVPRATLGGAFLIGGTALGLGAVIVALGYLIIAGRVQLEVDIALAIPLLLLGSMAFVAYAQALSTLLPRDTAAIIGVIALAFGATPAERWVPGGTPALVRELVQLVWSSMPTSLRLSELMAHREVLWNGSLFVAYVLAGLAVTAAQLRRSVNLRRRSDDS